MRKLALHVVFWIIFLFMWNQLVYFYISNPWNRIYFSLLDVCLVATAFYSIYLYIMPMYLRRKKTGELVLGSIALIAILSGIYSGIMSFFLHQQWVPIQFSFSWDYTDLQYNRFFIALLGVLAGCFVKLAVDRTEVARKMEMMEKEKSAAELTYLKAQINPHFLFNSLNNLHTQLELRPQEARSTLVSLADLLRYQLYECNVDYIPVHQELAYLENYIHLQKIRTDHCTLHYHFATPPSHLAIAPLLLIPFIENAFKHISDDDEKENSIQITVDFKGQQLLFHCCNTFDARPAPVTQKGIGLNNTRKRLELIYKNRYQLITAPQGRQYVVDLIIEL